MGILILFTKAVHCFECVELSPNLWSSADESLLQHDDAMAIQGKLDSAQLRLSRHCAKMTQQVEGTCDIQDQELQSIGEILWRILTAFDEAKLQSLHGPADEPWHLVDEVHSLLQCISLSRALNDVNVETQKWMLSDYTLFGNFMTEINTCINELNLQSLLKLETDDEHLCKNEAMEISKLQSKPSCLQFWEITNKHDADLATALTHISGIRAL